MANQPVNVTFPGLQLVGTHQSINVATVQAVTLPVGANGWYLQATGADIWIKLDSNNPAVLSGFLLRQNDIPVFYPAPNSTFFFYAIQAAATGILQAQGVSQPT